MVIDDECDYFWNYYVVDCCVCFNLGICWCLVLLVECDWWCIELLYSLLLLMLGMLILYYGDEIGMGDNIYFGDCDGVWILMQWLVDCNGGFFCVDLVKLVLLLILDLLYGYQMINVEVQVCDLYLLFNWMCCLFVVCSQQKVFGCGSLKMFVLSN